MAFQSAKNVTVAFKEETVFNTAPGASGAEYLRFTPSPGLSLKSANIKSNEQRADSLPTMGRNGSETVDGSYGGEFSIRSHDTIYQALQRGTWRAALVVTQATTGAAAAITIENGNQLIGTDGDWRTAGLRVGDVFRVTNVAGHTERDLRVKGFPTALILETMETDLADVLTPDASWTITIGKKLVNPATPTKRSFRAEQRSVDIDASSVFGGVKWTGMKINGTPDGMATVEFTALGASQLILKGVDSPYFTSPTVYNSVPLVFADAKINVSGSGDIAVATAFELNYQINAATQPVVGSKVSPDVFDNDASLGGSFSMIRSSFDNVESFVNETEFALHVLLTEPGAEPKPYIALFVPRCKYNDANAPLGGDGATIEVLPFTCGTQAEDVALGLDGTLMTMLTSAGA